MKGLAAFVMAGRGQAVLAVVAFSLLSVVIPPASYLAGGAVGLVTLRRGWLEGLVVTAGATLLAGALGWVALGSPLPVLALGGMKNELLATAQAHGAHGIALMRGW